MGWGVSGVRRGVFTGWIAVTIAACVVQSILHLTTGVGHDRFGSLFDLDRSNGVPDVVSTLVLGVAAVGAAALAVVAGGRERALAAGLAVVLAVLASADAAHEGPHPSSLAGWLVIAVVVLAAVFLAVAAGGWNGRSRVTIALAACALGASFFVNALDRLDPRRFEAARGEPIAEYQIVAKEGLELLGWSLVALVLWDEAIRRRRAGTTSARSPASPAPAARRRRAA